MNESAEANVDLEGDDDDDGGDRPQAAVDARGQKDEGEVRCLCWLPAEQHSAADDSDGHDSSFGSQSSSSDELEYASAASSDEDDDDGEGSGQGPKEGEPKKKVGPSCAGACRAHRLAAAEAQGAARCSCR